MSARRLGIEALVVAILALCAAGIWWWKDREAESLNRDWEARLGQARQGAERWASNLAASEAAAVFQAFAAGIAPHVLAENNESVDQAVAGLLELRDIVFVHVLAPDGVVIASSDRKLVTTGRAGEAAGWALSRTGVETRTSEREGVIEIAAPVVGPAGAKGYLWLGYQIAAARERTRPPTASAPGATSR